MLYLKVLYLLFIKYYMSNRILIIMLVLINSYVSNAQNEKTIRENFVLELAVDGKQYYVDTIKSAAYFVADKVLQIYPGDNLLIEATINADTITSMKVVKENRNPKNTIEISFDQEVEAKVHKMMMLKIKNPFEQELSYDAIMYVVGKDTWLKTSTIPIKPGLTNFETWPNVIISLGLSNWELK
jgi:hypothetical protein